MSWLIPVPVVLVWSLVGGGEVWLFAIIPLPIPLLAQAYKVFAHYASEFIKR